MTSVCVTDNEAVLHHPSSIAVNPGRGAPPLGGSKLKLFSLMSLNKTNKSVIGRDRHVSTLWWTNNVMTLSHLTLPLKTVYKGLREL